MDVVFAGSNQAYISVSRSNRIAVVDTNTHTHAGAAVCLGLHAHDRAGDHAGGTDVGALGLPLRADILELGDGHDLLSRWMWSLRVQIRPISVFRVPTGSR